MTDPIADMLTRIRNAIAAKALARGYSGFEAESLKSPAF